jgi:hypothetical protein
MDKYCMRLYKFVYFQQVLLEFPFLRYYQYFEFLKVCGVIHKFYFGKYQDK